MFELIISIISPMLVAIATIVVQLLIHRSTRVQNEMAWRANRRFPAYTNLLATVTECCALIGNQRILLSSRSRFRPWEPIIRLRLTGHFRRMHKAWDDLVNALAEVRLLGSPAVVAASEEALRAIEKGFTSVNSATPDDDERGTNTSRNLTIATTNLRDACRSELGQEVVGSDLA